MVVILVFFDKDVEDATQNWFSLRQTSAAQNMQTFQSENFQLANLCANLPIDMQIKPLTELNLTTYLFSFFNINRTHKFV